MEKLKFIGIFLLCFINVCIDRFVDFFSITKTKVVSYIKEPSKCSGCRCGVKKPKCKVK